MARSPKYTLSIDHAPLVVSTVLEDLNIEDTEEMFQRWREVLGRKERFVALVDVRAVKTMPSAKQRARTAELSKGIEPLSIQYSLGTATVFSSEIVRGAMIAIDWIHRQKIPQAHCTTLIEACDWCIERLRGAGLAITPSIEAYRAGLVSRGRSKVG